MTTASEDLPCSCCGRILPRPKLHALGVADAYICRRCGLWVGFRLRRDRPDDSDAVESSTREEESG